MACNARPWLMAAPSLTAHTRDMTFAIEPPLAPMDALSVADIPAGPGWLYEPKWDGFRCLAFRDGDSVHLQSKSGQPLQRYFPEVVETVRAMRSGRFVLDGELIIPQREGISFETLQLRLHPAESRVRKLALATPAVYVVFDLLADARRVMLAKPLAERHRALVAFSRHFADGARLSLSSARLADARRWLSGSVAGLDGVVAKRLDMDYRSGERTGMVKIKRLRTADCVVGGFRYSSRSASSSASSRPEVGSMLLGMYDRAGLLHHVGFIANIPTLERPALTRRLERLVLAPGFTGRAPGGPSRWSTERSSQWQPLRPELVVEVSYDHVGEERFRHGARLLRWRADKRPDQCTIDQLKG